MATTRFGVKEVCDVTFYDITTGAPKLHLDTLKLSSLENTATSVSARGGKGNPKLITWDYDREAMFNIQDALLSEDSLAMLTGTEMVTNATTKITRTVKKVVVNEGTEEVPALVVTLDETPDTSSTTTYLDGTALEAQPAWTANEGSVAGGKLTFTTGVEAGDEVQVKYTVTPTNATTVSIKSDKFPGYYKVVGDTVVRNAKTGIDEPFQIVIHKAKLQPGFTLTFQADGDPSVFDLNMEVFRRDEDTNMIELIKY